jgi:hypothetical protein
MDGGEVVGVIGDVATVMVHGASNGTRPLRSATPPS